jgi:hypothetical protein
MNIQKRVCQCACGETRGRTESLRNHHRYRAMVNFPSVTGGSYRRKFRASCSRLRGAILQRYSRMLLPPTRWTPMLSPLRSGRSSPRRIRQRRAHSQQQKLRRRQLNYAYAEGRYAPSFCFLSPKIAQGETMLVSPCTLCPLILGRSPVALALRGHRLTDSVLYQELCDVLVISNASQRAGGWEHLHRAVSQDHGSGLYKRRERICLVLNPDARPNKLEVLSRIERIQ